MDQHVAPVTVVDHSLGRSRVARDHDSSIRRLEPVAEGLRDLAVIDEERLHRDVFVLIHDARGDLVSVDLVSAVVVLRKVSLHAFCADPDVFFPRLKNVIRHGLDAARSVDLNGPGPADNPGGEDEVRVSDCVIRMQVGDEGRLEFREVKLFYFLPLGGRGPPNNAWTEVNEVWSVVDDNGDTRRRPFGIGTWSSRS